jgi:hypothetical protein
MKTKRTVLIFGGSLILATIGTFLQNREELEVVHIDANVPGSFDLVQAISPDVILFDLATLHTDTALSFLEVQPRLLLVGINLINGTMLVLCGHYAPAMTVDDLFQTILREDLPFTLSEA